MSILTDMTVQQSPIKMACFPGSRAFEQIQYSRVSRRGRRDCCTDNTSSISGEGTRCWSNHVEIVYCIDLLSICTVDDRAL